MPLDLLREFLPVPVGVDDRLEVGALLGQPGEVLAAAHDRGVDQPLLQVDVAALDVCKLVQHVMRTKKGRRGDPPPFIQSAQRPWGRPCDATSASSRTCAGTVPRGRRYPAISACR